MLPPQVVSSLEAIVGPANVKQDAASLDAYGVDATRHGHRPDVVACPGSAEEIAAVVRQCIESRVPLVPRGGGTGYTGGAVPIHGGVLLSLERLNRILEIDELNLVAVVEPNVITAHLQEAVERVGLFYPPDPSSLDRSVIGGNVAECAGGPRAFKYGTTKHYVLGLEVVLPTGELVRTGGKVVKNVVGYDLTQLLVGSEGTLAVITKVILRLIPKPPARQTLRASFEGIVSAAAAVTELLRARVVPASLEIIDRECLDAVSQYLNRSLAPPATGALLLIEVDGLPSAVAEEADRVEAACRTAGASQILRAADEAERAALWSVRRELSPSLHVIAPDKINHDVVVPRGRIPELFDLVKRLRTQFRLRMPCFGHAGDGNIHVHVMLDSSNRDELARARQAERLLFEGVIALEGSISGEHGIGSTKAAFIGIELSEDVIALMKRVKQAFDPAGILNPGKIFP